MTSFVYRKLQVYIHTFYSCPTPTSQGLSCVYLPFLIMRDIIIPNMFAYLIYLLEHNWSPFSSAIIPSSVWLPPTPSHPAGAHPPLGGPSCGLSSPWLDSDIHAGPLPVGHPALVSGRLCCPPFTRLWHSVCWTVPSHGSLLPLSGLWPPDIAVSVYGPLLIPPGLRHSALGPAAPFPRLLPVWNPSRCIPNRFRTEFFGKEGKEKGRGSETGGRRVFF